MPKWRWGAGGVAGGADATDHLAALDLLAEGKDPTRSNFKSKGIMSSTEVSGAVNLLASLGYIDPIVQGAPAEWASYLVPADVASIADHLRQDIPNLPVYEPVFAENASQAGQAGKQAGRQAGRRAGRRAGRQPPASPASQALAGPAQQPSPHL